jgi:hypothetical protein
VTWTKAGSVPAAAARGRLRRHLRTPLRADDRRAQRPQPARRSRGSPKPAEEDIHVEVEVDQAVYDQLIAEGKSERIARAKAKAAFVRAEKARIRAEREGAA